jgi:hypothetical protein
MQQKVTLILMPVDYPDKKIASIVKVFNRRECPLKMHTVPAFSIQQ